MVTWGQGKKAYYRLISFQRRLAFSKVRQMHRMEQLLATTNVVRLSFNRSCVTLVFQCVFDAEISALEAGIGAFHAGYGAV